MKRFWYKLLTTKATRERHRRDVELKILLAAIHARESIRVLESMGFKFDLEE